MKHTGRRQHDWLAAGSCNQLTRAGTIPKRPTSQHLNIPPSTKKFLSCLLIEVSDAGSWHGAQCNTASCKLPASDTPIYKQQGNLRPWRPRLQVTKDEGFALQSQASMNMQHSWVMNQVSLHGPMHLKAFGFKSVFVFSYPAFVELCTWLRWLIYLIDYTFWLPLLRWISILNFRWSVCNPGKNLPGTSYFLADSGKVAGDKLLSRWQRKCCRRQATFSLTAESRPSLAAEAWASPLATLPKLLHVSFCFAITTSHQRIGIMQAPNRGYAGQPFQGASQIRLKKSPWIRF